MAQYKFEQGHNYVIGLDKPMVVSANFLKGEVEKLGFRVSYLEPCEKLPALPFRTPSKCGDDWDWMGIVTRTAPTGMVDVPDRVKWIVDSTPVPAQPGQPPPPKPPAWVNPKSPPPTPGTPTKATVGGALVPVAVVLGGIWAIHKIVNR